jgi:hypothetical protein
MSTDKASIFELPVYRRGRLEKTLRNDTGKIVFGAIDDLSAIAERADGLSESDSPFEAIKQLRELLAPVLYEMFADYEEGDIDCIDIQDLVGFMNQFQEYLKARLTRPDEASKNRQRVAPQKQ